MDPREPHQAVDRAYLGRWVCRLGAVALVGMLAAGCQLYNLKALGFSNPFLPEARFFLTDSSQATSGGTGGGTSAVTITIPSTGQQPPVQWQVQEYPQDSDPGITLKQYTITYQDDNGQPISSALIPEQVLGLSMYVQPQRGNGGTPGAGSSPGSNPGTGTNTGIPGVGGAGTTSQNVGPSIVFGGPALNNYGTQALAGRYSPFLTAILTVYGVDDNGYSVSASLSIPIQFVAGTGG